MLKWLALVLASGFETGWAAGLKYAQGVPQWTLTILCIIGSSVFLVLATRMLPASIAYVSFVTLGAIGAYLLDVLAFGKEANLTAMAAIGIMLFCIARLEREK